MNKYKLKDLLSIKNGKDHKELNDGTIPIYGSGGIMRYGDKAIYTDESILLPRKGSLSNIQYVNKPFWTVDTIYYTVINKKLASPFYLYNFLKCLDLTKLNSGTGVPSMTFNSYYDLKIKLPDLPTQKSIAKVLSDLDAKIELNNKINQELEAMAKTLYDYWFVQFDFPTPPSSTSGIVGKPYKSSGGKMVYNAELKREIPEGWEVGTLNDAVSKTGTGLNPRKNFVLGEGDNYYVTIKSIEQGRVILDNKCDKISDETLKVINKRSDLQVGDILFTSIEPVGLTYLIQEVPKNWNINESVFTIRPNYKIVTSEFLYMFLSGDYIKSYTKNVAAGSIHKGIRHATLKECLFIIPHKELINYFTKMIRPILKKLDLLQKQNQQLSSLRDWLLPMLMNGQIGIQ